MRITPINNQRNNNKPAFGMASHKINILVTNVEKNFVPIVRKISGEVNSNIVAERIYILSHGKLRYPIQ